MGPPNALSLGPGASLSSKRPASDRVHSSMSRTDPSRHFRWVRESLETLPVVLPHGPIAFSRLGHGEGHGIVKSYREEKKERARFVPSSAGHNPAPGLRNP